jgi:hypothetical protein
MQHFTRTMMTDRNKDDEEFSPLLSEEAEKLLAAITPPKTYTGLPTEVNIREALRKPGRVPKFYRDEVEQIKQDTRRIEDIAASWGVSFDTIQRVRQAGRFKHVPYIPRDEIDRRVNYLTGEPVQPTMSEFPVPPSPKRGRPFGSGRREPMNDEEKLAIATDPRPPRDVAQEYGVSTSYVNKLRRQAFDARRGALSKGTIEAIRADERPHAVIARSYRVPIALVEHIKSAHS